MAPKRNTQHAAAEPVAAGPWNAASELPRQQLSLATEGACALFRGFEAMRKIQEKAAHQALAQHASAADRIKEAGDVVQLMEIQVELLRFDLEAATRYWQQLGAAALDMHSEWLSGVTQPFENGGLQMPANPQDMLPPFARGFAPFMAMMPGVPRNAGA